MSQADTTAPLTELGRQLEASTGAATKCQSGIVAGIVRKAMLVVELTSGFLARSYDFVEEKTTSAKVAAVGKGRTASAFVVDGLDHMKARGLTALSKVKKTVNDQVASVNVKARDVLGNVKARVVQGGSTIQQSALDFIPAGVKAQIVSAHGYTIEKFCSVKAKAANFSESTRERVLTQVTSAQIMTLNSIESAKTQAGQFGDVVLEYTPMPVQSGVATMYNSASTKASAAQQTLASVSDNAVVFSKSTASQVNTVVREVASDPKAQSAAIGAAGGAVTMGATGGAVGLASGSMAGAVVGLVPALFTFGLSIPIGAVLGGGAGLCVGTAVGGTSGLVVGGAAGYKKDSIASGTKNVLAQAGDCAHYAKEKASSVRARGRAMIGGTGGTEASESD